MAKKKADSKIVKLIYKLASDPSRVRSTQRAYYDMLAYNLTITGLCEAIQQWIDAGETVIEDVTQEAQSHIGKPIYIMKPRIEGQEIYLKLGIEKDPKTGEYMLIISSHP
ncbi:MAG: hypothetical protein JXA82_00065 [Sedimentisphaerales bacterium]|nr:hypothetical protein [Sedimentisphaerales bacterium]